MSLFCCFSIFLRVGWWAFIWLEMLVNEAPSSLISQVLLLLLTKTMTTQKLSCSNWECFFSPQGAQRVLRPRCRQHRLLPPPWRRWHCTATSANWGRAAAAWRPPYPRNTSHGEKKSKERVRKKKKSTFLIHCAPPVDSSTGGAQFTRPYPTSAEAAGVTAHALPCLVDQLARQSVKGQRELALLASNATFISFSRSWSIFLRKNNKNVGGWFYFYSWWLCC